MTKKNTKIQIENKITERVFSNDSASIQSILKRYLEKKVETAVNGLYDDSEIGTTSSISKEVA